MIINVYVNSEDGPLSKGTAVTVSLDENTKHQIGDMVDVKDHIYLVLSVDTEEHPNYASIVHVNRVRELLSKET